MKKFIPLCLALSCIVLFLSIIFKNEQHLKNSQSIYVHLQPVDPRSLIQGDYMVLSYQLYFAPQKLNQGDQNNVDPADSDENHIFSGHYFDQVIQNKPSVMAYVELDQQKKVAHTYFEKPKDAQTVKLILKNPDNRHRSLYPASNSFLFAEGLAECYQQAKYAEFKVDQQGNAILASLRGEHLQDLGCENKQRWRDGFRSVDKST